MEATREAKTYNGWTNYETWLVNLWMDNDEGSQNYYREQAHEASSAYELSQIIKAEHEEAMPETGANVFSDMLSAAFSSVNWFEIARHLWDDAHEDDDA